MQVAIPIFPRLTALDAIGPYEVLQRVPDVDPVFVGAAYGPVRSDFGALGIVVDATFDDVPAPDVVVVPGGLEDDVLADSNDPLVAWLKRVHPTTRWTTSVCTGALLLASAGLLRGLKATTHWASRATLRRFPEVHVTSERVVVEKDDRIITAAGVSSGIDMALWLLADLYGDRDAQAAQLMVEYYPHPPFPAGHPGWPGEDTIDDTIRNRAGALLKKLMTEFEESH